MIHQVAFAYRHLYGVQELKSRLLRGDIGDPYYVSAHYDFWEGMRPDSKIGYREKLEHAGADVPYDRSFWEPHLLRS